MKIALKIGSSPINTRSNVLDVKLNIPWLFILVRIKRKVSYKLLTTYI